MLKIQPIIFLFTVAFWGNSPLQASSLDWHELSSLPPQAFKHAPKFNFIDLQRLPHIETDIWSVPRGVQFIPPPQLTVLFPEFLERDLHTRVYSKLLEDTDQKSYLERIRVEEEGDFEKEGLVIHNRIKADQAARAELWKVIEALSNQTPVPSPTVQLMNNPIWNFTYCWILEVQRKPSIRLGKLLYHSFINALYSEFYHKQCMKFLLELGQEEMSTSCFECFNSPDLYQGPFPERPKWRFLMGQKRTKKKSPILKRSDSMKFKDLLVPVAANGLLRSEGSLNLNLLLTPETLWSAPSARWNIPKLEPAPKTTP